MDEKTVLLLGCNGQLGYESQSALPALGRLVALDFPDIDFTQISALRELVQEIRPDIIVNTAAYTAVDKAESDADKAHLINAAAPGALAEEAEALGAVFVHYSTDYVFDGTKAEPYLETDPTHPVSVYGRTKYDGELAAALCRRHLIFRTSWVVGVHGANFIKTMLRLAGERDSLKVVADQIGAPTSARLLADTTVAILRQVSDSDANDARWGTYHLVAGGETSWNGLARRVIARTAERGLALKAGPQDVAEITTAEFPTAAKRPANSRLSTEKLRRTFAIDLPDWPGTVDTIVDAIIAKDKS